MTQILEKEAGSSAEQSLLVETPTEQLAEQPPLKMKQTQKKNAPQNQAK
jgi:hypothetical protein